MTARALLALLPLTLVAACAAAPEMGAPTAMVTRSVPGKMVLASVDPDQMICTREAIIGSKRKRMFCATQRDREILAEQTRRALLTGSGVEDSSAGRGGTGNSGS